MISRVEPENVGLVWAELEPMILKGLSRGQGDECHPEVMKARIVAGDLQLWAVVEDDELTGACVLSVRDSAVRKVWVELLAGKNMDSWADELEGLLKDFRDLLGASCVEASCRPGLAAYLKERGWKQKAIIMSLKDE